MLESTVVIVGIVSETETPPVVVSGAEASELAADASAVLGVAAEAASSPRTGSDARTRRGQAAAASAARDGFSTMGTLVFLSLSREIGGNSARNRPSFVANA